MREDEYRAWMQATGLVPSSISTRISDSRRVEQYYGDLDEAFERDGMAELISIFTYTALDEASGQPNPTEIPVAGNLRNNLATYKSAVTTYRQFRQSDQADASPGFVLIDSDGERHVPVMQRDRATGREAYRIRPKGAGNRTADGRPVDTLDEFVRAILLEKLTGRFAPLGGGSPNNVGYAKQKFVAYEAAPDLAQRLGIPETLRTTPPTDPAMFIVTSRDGQEDGTERFLSEGRWSLVQRGRYDQLVREMKQGDVIVMRQYFTQTRDLPFDGGGRSFSAMRIRGVGRITDPSVDGLSVGVDWQDTEERVWYFYTNNDTVWRLPDGHLSAWKLREFILEKTPQDYAWFLNHPYWSDRESVGMDDATLLHRFSISAPFKAAIEGWTTEERAAFCQIARRVHDAGLDWWSVDINRSPIRFGRRNKGSAQAVSVLGYVRVNAKAIDVNTLSSGLDLGDVQFEISAKGAHDMVAALDDRADEVANWKPWSEPRPGLWPDEDTTIETQGEDAQMTKPTNLILYGPPGTGKTYRTAWEAVRLCDGTVDFPDDAEGRVALMARYRELQKEGRIRFVTFHQNFSYEEFVEGLRPETGGADEDDSGGAGFRLEPQPGIFRELSTVAEDARRRPAKAGGQFDFEGRKFWKMALGRIGLEDSVFEKAIEGEYVALGWGGDIDWSDDRYASADAIRDDWKAQAAPEDSPSHYTQLTPFRNTMQIGDIVIVPYGNKAFRAIGEVVGNYYFQDEGEQTFNHRRKVKWLAVPHEPQALETIIDGNFTMRSFYAIASSRIHKEALARLIGGTDEAAPQPTDGKVQQFVLIIDEINRANISKVFGELITLLEPDKRLGQTNALTVRLPYSKKEFGVPSNLHVIGTMNTADRSIALLDTALRRRFRFKELAPDASVLPEMVGAIPLQKVLTVMNQRIEYLIDRDHRIGHALFMGEDPITETSIKAAMRDKVIPLLAEYFFEDWSRIASVVGDGFLEKTVLQPPPGVEGDARDSWSVRSKFLSDAYARLIKGSMPSDEDAAPPAQEDDGEA